MTYNVNRKVTFLGVFPGVSGTVNTGLPIYPNATGLLSAIYAWAAGAVSVNTTITLYKNGVSFTTVTILAGQSTGSTTGLSLSVVSTDYFTAGISGSSTNNAGFSVEIMI
jgi:hypothetical protein